MNTYKLIKNIQDWIKARERHQLDNTILVQVIEKLEKLRKLEQQASGFLVSK